MGEEIKRKPGAINVFSTAVFSGLIAVVGYVSLLVFGHVTFGASLSLYPSQSLFPLAGIWFGAWGVLAAYIGNMISVLATNPLHVAPFLALSTIFQAAIPAWAFRFFKADPRLRTSRDAMIFIIFGVVLNGLASMFIGPTIWYLFGYFPWRQLIYVSMPAWFTSGLIVCTTITMPLLKVTSAAVMRTRAYVKGWLT